MLMIVVEGVVTNYRGGGGSGCCATRLIQRFNPTSHIAISTSPKSTSTVPNGRRRFEHYLTPVGLNCKAVVLGNASKDTSPYAVAVPLSNGAG
jgi:hypothetical protein